MGEEAAVSTFWRGLVGWVVAMTILWIGRPNLDDDWPVLMLWSLGAGVIGLLVSLSLHLTLTHLRKRRVARTAGH